MTLTTATAPQPVFRIAGYANEAAERLALLLDDPETDLDDALAVLAITDNVARDASNIIATMPAEDKYTGDLASLIMLPFIKPYRARFNDATFGAWYAANSVKTAYEEKAFHLTRWLSLSTGTPLDLRQRIIQATVTAPLHNACKGQPTITDDIYNPDPEAYDAANALARNLKSTNSNGVIYNSVRHPDGTCVAIFRPAIIEKPTVDREIFLEWNDGTLKGFEAL